jgi:hypothetical protein
VREDEKTGESVLIKLLKLFVISLQLYHVNVKGPVPPGLAAFSEPLIVPVSLQVMKMGSCFNGADGYVVYLISPGEGDVICPKHR